jgi:hypothetical protein
MGEGEEQNHKSYAGYSMVLYKSFDTLCMMPVPRGQEKSLVFLTESMREELSIPG